MNDAAIAATPLEGVEVRRSGVHGHGVFAMRTLWSGQEIGTYAGRRYPPDEAHDGWDDHLTYLFRLSDDSVIDGAQGGNVMRHLNHACEPNVEAIEDCDADDDRVLVIRAMRDIAAGEELFLDYALDVDGDDPADYPCGCGAVLCRGTLAASSVLHSAVEASSSSAANGVCGYRTSVTAGQRPLVVLQTAAMDGSNAAVAAGGHRTANSR